MIIRNLGLFWVLLLALNSSNAQVNTDKKPDFDEYLGEIEVLASRLPQGTYKQGGSSTVITEQDLREKNYYFISDYLQEEAGLEIIRPGSQGATTSLILRGAPSSDHALVLVDGMEIGDPANIQKSYDFSNISVSDIEKIEIIKGPNSVAQGSNATAGVINIVTKKPLKSGVRIKAELGSYETSSNSVTLNKKDGNLYTSIGISQFLTGGFSHASEGNIPNRPGLSLERDAYSSKSVSAKVGYQNDFSHYSLFHKYTDSRLDLDGSGVDKSDDYQNSYENITGLGYDQSLIEGFWTLAAKLNRYSLRRINKEMKTSFSTGNLVLDKSLFIGTLNSVDIQNTFSFKNDLAFIFGISGSDEKADINSPFSKGIYSTDSKSLYAIVSKDFFKIISFSIGVRYSDYKSFGDHTTYQIKSTVDILPKTLVAEASFGTGFKAPSLFQIHGIGQKNELNPEENSGGEVGLTYNYNPVLSLNTTVFKNSYKNIIEFQGSSYKNNPETINTTGLEVSANIKLPLALTLNHKHTFTEAEYYYSAIDKKIQRARVPKSKFYTKLTYRPIEKISSSVGIRQEEKRNDIIFDPIDSSFSLVELGSYRVIGASFKYHYNKDRTIYIRGENLADEKYQTVHGYNTPRRAFYVGTEFSL